MVDSGYHMEGLHLQVESTEKAGSHDCAVLIGLPWRRGTNRRNKPCGSKPMRGCNYCRVHFPRRDALEARIFLGLASMGFSTSEFRGGVTTTNPYSVDKKGERVPSQKCISCLANSKACPSDTYIILHRLPDPVLLSQPPPIFTDGVMQVSPLHLLTQPNPCWRMLLQRAQRLHGGHIPNPYHVLEEQIKALNTKDTDTAVRSAQI